MHEDKPFKSIFSFVCLFILGWIRQTYSSRKHKHTHTHRRRCLKPKWLKLGSGFTFAIVHMTMQVYSRRLYFTHSSVVSTKHFPFLRGAYLIYINSHCECACKRTNKCDATEWVSKCTTFFSLSSACCARSSFQPLLLCEVSYCNLPKNKTYANINAHVASFRERNAYFNHKKCINSILSVVFAWQKHKIAIGCRWCCEYPAKTNERTKETSMGVTCNTCTFSASSFLTHSIFLLLHSLFQGIRIYAIVCFVLFCVLANVFINVPLHKS